MGKVLDGIRVLDLSRFIAGPVCAMQLADMGADVVKVERPGGEDARHHAPFLAGHSLFTMVYNRNKRAVTLDTRHPRGQEMLGRLVEWADVLVENYRPGTLAKMGLDHDELRRLNTRLVVTSISGAGQTGPDRERAMFDAVAQAASGLAYHNGDADDPPLLTGVFVADYLTGAYAAYGTMLALFHRERTGEGQVVDVALMDSLFSVLGIQTAAWLGLGEKLPRRGNRDAYTAPAKVFRANDGYIYLHAGTNGLFRRLTQVLHRPDLLDDARFAGVTVRMDNADAIESIVQDWVGDRTVAEVSRTLGDVGVPSTPVLDIEGAVRSEQLAAREMLVEVVHSEAGPVVLPGVPVKLSRTPGGVDAPPPTVGQHNEEVYGELLGVDKEALDELRSAGVV